MYNTISKGWRDRFLESSSISNLNLWGFKSSINSLKRYVFPFTLFNPPSRPEKFSQNGPLFKIYNAIEKQNVNSVNSRKLPFGNTGKGISDPGR